MPAFRNFLIPMILVVIGIGIVKSYNPIIQMGKVKDIESSKAYIGMWVTLDGYIRHELLPSNRYDEARGNRKSAYQGKYTITGDHIDYKDDTGFSADGYFKEGILYHAGMILYKEEKQP